MGLGRGESRTVKLFTRDETRRIASLALLREARPGNAQILIRGNTIGAPLFDLVKRGREMLRSRFREFHYERRGVFGS